MGVFPDFSKLEEVEFEVEKEIWNEYKLSDGTILRLKVVVVKFFKTGQVDPLGMPVYIVAFQNVLSVRSPERRAPNPPPGKISELPDEKKEDVEINEILKEDWNRYIVEDKYIYELKPVIARIIKLKGYYDSIGYPVYHVISRTVERVKERR